MNPAVQWRLLVDRPLKGSANMARDHGLALCCPPGVCTVRLYRWASPTVSFGRNEPAGAYRDAASEHPDLAFVRRPTGGRAVLHDGEVTYAVVFPKGALGGLRQAYARIQRGLVAALVDLGVAAQHAAAGQALPPDAGPCFSAAAPGEVVVGGRKVAGSAQVRIGPTILQHGSLLTACDQRRLAHLSPGAAPDPAQTPPVTLKEILGRTPTWEVLVEALTRGMSAELGGPLEETGLTEEEIETEGRLLGQYESPDWTWRR